MSINMGNNFKISSSQEAQPSKKFESVENFRFHDIFLEETNNGLYLNEVYFPEEIVMLILSYVDPKQLLSTALVCKKWCNIIKSDSFWASIYYRHSRKKPKKLPWFTFYCYLTTDYFDNNLIKNGNGEDKFKHWNIVLNYGDAFRIEDPPSGADPLPVDVPEFHGKTSCFATSYYECNKLQEISLENNRLMQLIFDKYKPHIYLSEWTAARFDCGCIYNLWCKLFGAKDAKVATKRRVARTVCEPMEGVEIDNFTWEEEEEEEPEEPLHVEQAGTTVEQWAGSTWSKIELITKNYPSGVRRIVFQHEGRDTQFWKGHYGSKMAGGVLKILFDTIEPVA